MKKMAIFVIAAICLVFGSAYAADDCDTGYRQYMVKLGETKKISEQSKQKYMLMIEKAYSLCKQGKREEASNVMDDLKDQFFEDAMSNQRQFFGN